VRPHGTIFIPFGVSKKALLRLVPTMFLFSVWAVPCQIAGREQKCVDGWRRAEGEGHAFDQDSWREMGV
jgi:hypothetical protein